MSVTAYRNYFCHETNLLLRHKEFFSRSYFYLKFLFFHVKFMDLRFRTYEEKVVTRRRFSIEYNGKRSDSY